MNKRAFTLSSLVPLLILLGACEKYSDQVKDQAKTNADGSVEATNEDLRAKADALEADLASRRRFYTGIAGTYRGQMTGPNQWIFETEVTLTPSVPPYQPGRQRLPEEVLSDLNSLSLTLQIRQWDAETGTAFGCVFSLVHPDYTEGHIEAAAPDCPNAFRLDLGAPADLDTRTGTSQVLGSGKLASMLMGGRLANVDSLAIGMKPTRSATSYGFSVHRVSP